MDFPTVKLNAKGLIGQTSSLSDTNLAPYNPRPTTTPALPFGYQTMPTLRKNVKLITINYRQTTPWCRDMQKWFTPDPKMGLWIDTDCCDRYRIQAFKERLKPQKVFHFDSGLISGYSGHVPGQKFRHGSAWTKETRNARREGICRPQESTTLLYFANRSIGP